MSHINANGVRTHVQTLGEGDATFVFVHGLLVDNLSSFYFTLAGPIAKHAKVILYDMRGHGKSERPVNGYDLDTLIADLDSVIDSQSKDRPVFLLGNSFGGLLAMAYAKAFPDKVEGLVLVDPLLPLDGWQEDMHSTLNMTGEVADAVIADLYKNWHGRNSSRKKKTLQETGIALTRKTSLLDDLLVSHHYTPDELAHIACPVLALYGKESNVLEAGRKMMSHIENASLRIIPNCTHLVLFEGTEFIVSTVEGWLATLTLASEPHLPQVSKKSSNNVVEFSG